MRQLISTYNINSSFESGTISYFNSHCQRITSPQKPKWLASSSALFPLFFAFISREIRKTIWVHCQVHLGQLISPSATVLLRAPGSSPTTIGSLGVLADRLCGEQSLQMSWQGEESGLAMSVWGLWNPSIMELLGASTVTSSAPCLRISNWAFSWCLYTKLVNYENLSTAFSY